MDDNRVIHFHEPGFGIFSIVKINSHLIGFYKRDRDDPEETNRFVPGREVKSSDRAGVRLIKLNVE